MLRARDSIKKAQESRLPMSKKATSLDVVPQSAENKFPQDMNLSRDSADHAEIAQSLDAPIKY